MVTAAQRERTIRVAIIGGGISGVAQAIRLKELLGKNVAITIYERATEPGGVWRDSKWEGAGVDIPIVLYQLYSELNPNWSTKFAQKDEVLAYWNGIIDKHDLRSSFVFSVEFVASSWSTRTQSHTLTFTRDSLPNLVVEADVLISAAGALNTPIIPALPGRASFEGTQFHSSRWNDVDLRSKKVAIIGNGSSGIQVVPYIVGREGIQVTQFIRSPGYFTPKVNHDYTPFEKFAFNWVPGLQKAYRWYLFYKFDSAALSKGMGWWTSALRERQTKTLIGYLQAKAPAEYLSILTPTYPLHCKRVAYNAQWLESLHLPNVHLTATPITAVTPKGLLTKDGVEHEFDVIVWATGFDVSRTGVGLNEDVKGEEEGKDLKKVWEEKEGAEAFLSVAVPKFPNYFIILGPNAISMSWGYTLGNQTEFIARLVQGLHTHSLTSIAPKVSVAKAYNVALQDRLGKTVLVSTACNAWYRYKGFGKVIAPSGFSATELYLRTRKINWEDWEVRSASTVAEFDGTPGIVDLKTSKSWNPFERVYDVFARGLERYLVRIATE